MKKFEYYDTVIDSATLVPILNEYGNKGWEAIAFAFQGANVRVVFKREKK